LRDLKKGEVFVARTEGTLQEKDLAEKICGKKEKGNQNAWRKKTLKIRPTRPGRARRDPSVGGGELHRKDREREDTSEGVVDRVPIKLQREKAVFRGGKVPEIGVETKRKNGRGV